MKNLTKAKKKTRSFAERAKSSADIQLEAKKNTMREQCEGGVLVVATAGEVEQSILKNDLLADSSYEFTHVLESSKILLSHEWTRFGNVNGSSL